MKETENSGWKSAILKGTLIGVLLYLVFMNDYIQNIYNDYFNEENIENLAKDEKEETSLPTEILNNNSTEIFTVVEDMPLFEGCESLNGDDANQCTMQKIQAYTAQVEYPQIAIDNDIEGKVYISFVVNVHGNVTNVKLLRGVDKLLDNAALNHLKQMPKFAKPGLQKGKAVSVKYSIPIVFKLG